MVEGSSESTYTVRVGADKAGGRLDKVLAEALPGLSRTRLKSLIAEGRVAGPAGPATDPALKVKGGEEYRVAVPAAVPALPAAQAIGLEIIYEDDQLIVVDKPAGMVVHPAPGSPDRTLVNALLAHCGDSLSGIGGVRRPGIVHRLDKDTSGLMVVAKTDAAHRALAAQFAAHSLERAYLAVVWGVPNPLSDEIAGNIGRSPRNRKKMAVVTRGGKPALTRYRVVRILGRGLASLIECRLATGRTHQIRVHLASRGHPVVGDPVYGRSRRSAKLPEKCRNRLDGFRRQALHAYLIGFSHPESRDFKSFKSNLPFYINELISFFERV
jgi:23S rRNA pseudouridine1911/1915/1917 synthase